MVTQIVKGRCSDLARRAQENRGAGNTRHPASGGRASDPPVPESLPPPVSHSTALPRSVTRGGAGPGTTTAPGRTPKTISKGCIFLTTP